MRKTKDGFELAIEGRKVKIFNRYGCVGDGEMILPDKTSIPNNLLENYAEKFLEEFIRRHSVVEMSNPRCVKKVAFDEKLEDYIQLQALLPGGKDYWIVQKFDNELVYMGEEWSGCKRWDEVQDWMRVNYDIESCLTAGVYRDSKLGDCTNGGISSHAGELYILSEKKGPFEPEDIRQCVYIEWREVCGEPYIDCKPAYFRKRWYMAGGNFLYTSDSRFVEITKSKYPISIHDRYEGRLKEL